MPALLSMGLLMVALMSDNGLGGRMRAGLKDGCRVKSFYKKDDHGDAMHMRIPAWQSTWTVKNISATKPGRIGKMRTQMPMDET